MICKRKIIKVKEGIKVRSRLPGEYYIIPRNEAKKWANKNGYDWDYIRNAPLGPL